MHAHRSSAAAAASWLAIAVAACAPGGDAASGWAGTVDTLASGQVVVSNPDRPLWPEGAEWRLVEDLRIGRVDEEGPYLFGDIRSVDVDPAGRIWVLEGQAQELRVFGPDGAHVRTVGRKGGGPGEFNGALQGRFGPGGRLWVIDPPNNRISLVDTTGAFVGEHRALGGFFIYPWPGGFAGGSYYTAAPDESADEFRVALVRHDTAFTTLDSLPMPTDPVSRERFELRSGDGVMMASVPFSGSFRALLSPRGTVWGLLTDEYRLFELDRAGDTLRTIRRAYDPLRVTADERDAVLEDLSWFTGQGGKVDLSKIPDVKPAAEDFYVDGEGRVWVSRYSDRLPRGQAWDVFDPAGRFLGPVDMPAPIQRIEAARGDTLYAIARDELDVPFVLRIRIERP